MVTRTKREGSGVGVGEGVDEQMRKTQDLWEDWTEETPATDKGI